MPSAREIGPSSRRVWDAVRGLVVPPLCAACDAPLDDLPGRAPLCRGCRERLLDDDAPACPRCGLALAPAAPRGESCASCRDESGWRLDAVVRLGRYSGELRSAVLRTKRPDDAPLAAALAEALLERRRDELLALDGRAVVPVPMFWGRRLFRGADAPETIAETLARRLKLPLASGWLTRSRSTELLESLSPTARREAVRNAFAIGWRKRLTRDWLGSRPPERVLLVDDVLTSGATANEAARTLKRLGAKFVAAVVIARTERERT